MCTKNGVPLGRSSGSGNFNALKQGQSLSYSIIQEVYVMMYGIQYI